MKRTEVCYKNGDVYIGEVNEGQLSGKGVYRFKNGSLYEGQFEAGQFEGRGKLVDTFNQITIVGTFKQGQAHGSCRVNYSDGSSYEGDMSKGARCGKGVFTYCKQAQELQYKGSFQEDDFEGHGQLAFKNGDLYRGNFMAGQFNLEGELVTAQATYLGDFKKGVIEGKGMVKYKSGDVYDGSFAMNCKEGFGKYTYANGSVYQGDWRQDKRQGRAKVTGQSGLSYEGAMHNDEYSGRAVYHHGDWQIETVFEDSLMNGEAYLRTANTQIEGFYSKGAKEGLFTVKKTLPNGKQASYRGEFKNNREKPHSVGYSGRF